MPSGGKRVPGPGKTNGRPRKPAFPPIADRGAAARIIDALNALPSDKEPIEIAGWRGLWDNPAADIRLRARIFLYDKRDGRSVHTVNHLHDKPLEHTVTLNLSERFRIAMEKASKRVSDLR